MNKYHVTYYYLATGMDGIADYADYGYIMAENEQEAINKVGWQRSPNEKDEIYRNWGLSASIVDRVSIVDRDDLSRIFDIPIR